MRKLFLCLLVFTVFFHGQLFAAKQRRLSIENKDISESSGLGCSTRDPQVIWTHNDSLHMPIIYAMDINGRHIRSYFLEQAELRDWEDMDAFEWNKRHYLLIADTGDNFLQSLSYRFYILEEPDTGRTGSFSPITPKWTIDFQYRDRRSYDVEAAAVDVKNQKILMLSKRSKETYLFELPLIEAESNTSEFIKAKKLGSLKHIKNPTSMAFSGDGRLMAVLSYGKISLLKKIVGKEQNMPWKLTKTIPYRNLYQPEGLCLSKDGRYFYVSTEKRPVLLKISNF